MRIWSFIPRRHRPFAGPDGRGRRGGGMRTSVSSGHPAAARRLTADRVSLDAGGACSAVGERFRADRIAEVGAVDRLRAVEIGDRRHWGA